MKCAKEHFCSTQSKPFAESHFGIIKPQTSLWLCNCCEHLNFISVGRQGKRKSTHLFYALLSKIFFFFEQKLFDYCIILRSAEPSQQLVVHKAGPQ